MLTSFSCEHDGMGSFLLCSKFGETYRAVCRSDEIETEAPLPAVKEGVCAVSVVQAQGRIHYKVDGTFQPGSTLVIYFEGAYCCIVPVDPSMDDTAADSLGEGILHLLLVDSVGGQRSERLVFIGQPQRRERWTVTPGKPRYGKREKVRGEIGLKDCDGNLLGMICPK